MLPSGFASMKLEYTKYSVVLAFAFARGLLSWSLLTYYSLSVMWLITVFIINTLTMLTMAHAYRGIPALNDHDRFRNGLVRDLVF